MNDLIKHYKISRENDHAISGVWHQFRENPSGTRLVYVNFEENIPKDSHDYREAWIYTCNLDGTSQKKLWKTGKINDHNGANAYWIDDNRIIYHSRNSENREETYVRYVDSGEIQWGPILDAEVRNYNPTVKKAPLIKRPNKGVPYAELSLLDVDTGEIEVLFTAKEIAEKLQHWKVGNPEPSNWEFFLQFINPSGTHIAWIVNTLNETQYVPGMVNKGSEGTIQYLVSSRLDGTDFVVFGLKDFHQYWWDDETLFGFNEPEHSYICHIRKRDGSIVQTLAEEGNHGTYSPDRKWFVSDAPYSEGMQRLYLYRVGNPKPYKVLAEFDYKYEYGHRLHLDPSFSRDGKRVYYTKIVDIKQPRAQVFACDLSSLIEY